MPRARIGTLSAVLVRGLSLGGFQKLLNSKKHPYTENRDNKYFS